MKKIEMLYVGIFLIFAVGSAKAQEDLLKNKVACMQGQAKYSQDVMVTFPEIEFTNGVISPRSEEKLAHVALVVLNSLNQHLFLSGPYPHIRQVQEYLMRQGLPFELMTLVASRGLATGENSSKYLSVSLFSGSVAQQKYCNVQ